MGNRHTLIAGRSNGLRTRKKRDRGSVQAWYRSPSAIFSVDAGDNYVRE